MAVPQEIAERLKAETQMLWVASRITPAPVPERLLRSRQSLIRPWGEESIWISRPNYFLLPIIVEIRRRPWYYMDDAGLHYPHNASLAENMG